MKDNALKNKRLMLLFAAVAAMVIAMAGLAGCGGNSAPSSSAADSGSAAADAAGDYADLEPVTLIAADSASPGSAGNLWAELFAEKLEAITGGQMKVDYHGAGELGGDVDVLTQAQANDVQIFTCQPAPMVAFIPELATFDLPMVFATYDSDQIESVLNGDNEFTQGLQEAYGKAKMYNLGWLQDATYRQATSNKELRTLEDFKGWQIRTMENKNHMAFWTALGAEPTPLAFSEVYISLQNGTIEGEENATDTVVGNSLQEVQKYLAKTNHLLYANAMVISKQCWDGLTDEQKATIEQAVQEATAEIAPTLGQLDADSTKKMQDDGVEVIEYDDSFFQAVQDNADVQKLNEDIDGQCGGLLTTLKDELAKAAK